MNMEELIKFLVPRLPHLLGPDGSALASDTKASSEKAQLIWQVLSPELNKRAAARTAIEQLIVDSSAIDWQQSLHAQIRAVFSEHPEIAEQVKDLWQRESLPASNEIARPITMTISGANSQAFGNVSGTVYSQVNAPIDASQGNISAEGGAQISGRDSIRSGSNFFSQNRVTLVVLLIGIVALGTAWALGVRLSGKDIIIETEGGEQIEKPEKVDP